MKIFIPVKINRRYFPIEIFTMVAYIINQTFRLKKIKDFLKNLVNTERVINVAKDILPKGK